ncbi:MAG: response regulator [Bacteroidetes bacterium]|nr:response regulator [Bacteroidota bacterium]MBP6657618.1 response regulator [Bacteroidia bacterium]
MKQFLIVDDDPQNNSLSRMAIRKVLGNVPVKDFEVPETGLEYIGKDFETGSSDEKTVLLLDINMPTMTGWEFLEEFDKLSENIKMQFQIFMLSSSVDPSDIERATSNPLVTDFIEKPLNKEALERMFG